MSNITAIGSGVFVDQDLFPSVGRAEIEFLDRGLADNPRGRTRLCMHKQLDDRMHEMFISFVGGNYVRPAKHVGKDESLHLIEGWGDYFFFDEQRRGYGRRAAWRLSVRPSVLLPDSGNA